MHGYVVMPDHVHLLFTLCQGAELSQVMKVFKGYSARRINALLGRKGNLWEKQYHDHGVRDEKDFVTRLHYMLENPERLGLVDRYEEWTYSSAHPTRSETVTAW